jgi:hypothetical protein
MRSVKRPRADDCASNQEGHMAAKKKSKVAPESADPIEPDDVLSEDEILKLDYNDMELIERTLRLLVAIQTPSLLLRARRDGYSPEEHRTGQLLWTKAVGIDRPLDHFFTRGVALPVESAEGQRILQDLDTFENIWFPRTRAIIRRAVSKERREGFEAAFFADLAQQPLGPQVVGSVSSYLARVEGLEKSQQPDASALRKMLNQRGLTAGKVNEVRGLIDKLGQLTLPNMPVNVQAVREADAAQREALDHLRDWYRDWATTLRTLFPTQVQIRLGLTRRRRAEAADDTTASEETAAAEEA